MIQLQENKKEENIQAQTREGKSTREIESEGKRVEGGASSWKIAKQTRMRNQDGHQRDETGTKQPKKSPSRQQTAVSEKGSESCKACQKGELKSYRCTLHNGKIVRKTARCFLHQGAELSPLRRRQIQRKFLRSD